MLNRPRAAQAVVSRVRGADAVGVRLDVRPDLPVCGDETFSRTVWRLYGGAKGLVMSYYPALVGPVAARVYGGALPLAVEISCAYRDFSSTTENGGRRDGKMPSFKPVS